MQVRKIESNMEDLPSEVITVHETILPHHQLIVKERPEFDETARNPEAAPQKQQETDIFKAISAKKIASNDDNEEVIPLASDTDAPTGSESDEKTKAKKSDYTPFIIDEDVPF